IAWSVQHSAFGYAPAADLEQMFCAASRWMASRHGWEPEPDTFAALSDVVQGLHLAIHVFTEPGDGVIVQGPIYPPFLTSIKAQERRIVDNRLIDPSGAAELDLDGLRRAAADPRTKLLLLCNPHNPTGRVLRRDELEAIAAVAVEHDLVVVADEIWMDVVFPGHRYIPFAALGGEVAARTITMTSATKSFNLGGLRCAVAIFGSPALRERVDALPARIRGAPSVLSIRATTAAWKDGAAWFDAVMRQLDANRQFVGAFVRERLPGVRHRTPEGTYLAWLDFGGLELGQPAAAFLLERARVALNDGDEFGGDAHCARLNFAATPAILSEICERVAGALG
ncbi:MAG: aminotransferase class I/II-fold pyridoxal phosphate-dependent enzyme, partial [Armatimonadetes bacterium]|nr:aminotransferase class I/II-fold pyridoxal phosphate-dependent enzyme [Armatimonadota bacterium]